MPLACPVPGLSAGASARDTDPAPVTSVPKRGSGEPAPLVRHAGRTRAAPAPSACTVLIIIIPLPVRIGQARPSWPPGPAASAGQRVMTAWPAAVFQQITGITTITCCAPALLPHAGFGDSCMGDRRRRGR